MTGTDNDAAPPPGGAGPARLWRGLVETLTAAGTMMVGIPMVIICADIVARNAMGASLPLVSEGGALLLVTLVALQLAATVRSGRLARTEVIIAPLMVRHPRAGVLLEGLFDVVGAVVLGLIAWSSVRVVGKDFAAAEFIGVTGIATLPTWPFRVLILAGFAVAAIEFAVRALADFRRALGART